MFIQRRSLILGAGALIASPAFAQGLAPIPSPYQKGVQNDPTEAGPLAEGMVRVIATTPEGQIVIDLNQARAPITTANFLHYVDTKHFDNITFYRASHPPGDVTYGVLQGGLKNDPDRLYKSIAHESTLKTGLFHRHGTISMARNAPGSANADFFICVGDQAYLDANPEQPGDNQGFAAFGSVASGMTVVKTILGKPTGGKAANPVMAGEMLSTPVPITTIRRAPAA